MTLQVDDLKVGDAVLVSRFIGFGYGYSSASGALVWEKFQVKRVTKTTLEVEINGANTVFTKTTRRQRGESSEPRAFPRCFDVFIGNEAKLTAPGAVEDATRIMKLRKKLIKRMEELRSDFCSAPTGFTPPAFDRMTLAELDKLDEITTAAGELIRNSLRRR